MADRPVFPFSALVGQERLKKALLLNAIDPRIGGVLIRGEKGTAKSTAVRGFAQLLPAITVVADCPYHCDPDGLSACPRCTTRRAAGETLPRAQRLVPLVELPLGATDDRVVGTLSFERAIKDGERVFEPGLLAEANRGILYVDEVNLLGDHLVDVLLDAAAMGQNYVEREGVSVAHPAQFILIGTMNPEEGDLRPQLLDRFALAVTVEAPRDPLARAEVVRRRIAFEADPEQFLQRWRVADDEERHRVRRARALLPSVQVTDQQIEQIGQICAALAIDGLRGDIVFYKTAVALAAYAGRTIVSDADLREAADLALLHRRRRQPFDDPQTGQSELDQVLDQYLGPSDGAAGPDGSGRDPGTSSGAGTHPAAGPDRKPASEEQTFPVGSPFPLRPFPAPRPASPAPAPPGRRGSASDSERRGHPVSARQPVQPPRRLSDLAISATLRAAAPFQPQRRQDHPGGARLRLRASDLRERVREARGRNLLLFVVDASGSMGARQRMIAVKGAILSLLVDAYQKRDRVALIAFRGEAARLVLPPTTSVDLAERRLRALPTGGRTPLAHALLLGEEVIRQAQASPHRDRPWLILISDGRPNVALSGHDAWHAARQVAERIRRRRARVLVIDSEPGPVRLGRNRPLAAALGGEYLRLEELGASSLVAAVRQRQNGWISW